MTMGGAEAPEGLCDPEELVSEDGYTVKVINTREGLMAAYGLRYSVFCRRLGWVGCREGELEYDSYDESAVSFGLYDGNGILKAYVRLIMSDGRFMLEDNFSTLLGDDPIIRKQPDTAEMSRLCTRPLRDLPKGERDLPHDLVLLLFRGVHRWCALRGIRFLYTVTQEKIYNIYKSEVPFRLMGEPMEMPDGEVAHAAVLDLREYEALGRS